MKELQDIVAAFKKVEGGGTVAALATLVKAQGSTYRRPGARMLMTSQGQMVGSLSGGCLEGDVFEQAQAVMTSGKPIVVQYDTTSDEDIIWGLGLGCNGIVQILLERLEQESPFNHLAFLTECLRLRQVGVLATVFHVEGQVEAQVGTRLMINPDGTLNSDIENADLVAQVRDDAWKAFEDSRSQVKAYPLPTGKAEVFIEVIQPPVPLMIFGAGHDAVPLVRLGQELGWYVTVVDTRKIETTRERFQSANEVILSRPETLEERIHVNNRTMAVVMTHNYLHDLELLKTLLPSPAGYLGILGPKSRTGKLLQDLQEQGITPTEKQLQRLYSPVGLDIGADSPEEIALSIVAEIQAVLANHSGGSLRNKQGPIHDRSLA
ncbi:MAG TPA: XdhC/CoxI family protein [Waterburya sp.]|jgi:xanthine/CO dehydrogenase XdhC/CoxF family maturation factor